ncbi:hypothetical protein_gp061 [Bacillus phage vB_BceM_WH1]|nr:hypothetical protein_gp061 [Bacillus phage vB_BceM_WH1]
MSPRVYEIKPGERIKAKTYVDVPDKDTYKKRTVIDGVEYLGAYEVFERRLSKFIHDFEKEFGLEVDATLNHSYYSNVHHQKIVLNCKELVPEGSFVVMKQEEK